MEPRDRQPRSHLPLLTLAGLLWIALLTLWTPGGRGLLETLDNRTGDILARWEATHRAPPDNIFLVEVDQSTLEDPAMIDAAGHWPWPRAVHGDLLEFITRQHPRAVVFDLMFSVPDTYRRESDQVFGEMLRRYPAYLPLVFTDGVASPLKDLPPIMGIRPGPQAEPAAALPLIAPKALAPDLWRTGLVNFFDDEDGVGRRYWLHYPVAGWTIPSLPARVAADLGMVVPEQASMPLHFYGRPFPRASYRDIYLASQQEHPEHVPDLRDKIVIIGITAPGLNDLHATPLDTLTPGPHILATALANLQEGDILAELPRGDAGLFGLLLVLAIAGASRRQISPLVQGGALLFTSLLCLLACALLLQGGWLWKPYSMLLSGWLFYALCALDAYLRERQQRELTVTLFGRFLDPRVVHNLTASKTLATAQEGSSREITVLFSDIRGFTTLSEKRAPEEIVRLLNQYFDSQVEAIFQCEGTLDKFIGDAIMAFWGAPVDQPDHAVLAVSAALAMQARLEAFKASLGDEVSGFDIGIGLHSGPAVVGFLGARQRLDYTAIGDTVNLASRIEGVTKGVARVLVSEATKLACEARAPDAFTFIDRGVFSVKGREDSVRLFEPRSRS